MELSPAQQHLLLKLARAAMRKALAGESGPPPDCAEPTLRQMAGCFVSLHRIEDHRLRGCVGRLEAKGPLWDTVWATAANVLRDPRFAHDPVRPAELSRLLIELSVLSPLVPAAGPLDFDPLNDGIYLMCAGRTGCFLPQVGRETGWSREQLLGRLCTEKMGLPPTFWMQAGARLMTFSTIVIGPEPVEGQIDATHRETEGGANG